MLKKFLPLACLFFVFGVGVTNLIDFNLNPFYLFLILLCCVVLSILNWQKKKLRSAAMLAAFLFLGMWRFQISEPIINKNYAAFYNNQKISLVGQIVAEPDERENGTKLTIGKIVGTHCHMPNGQCDYDRAYNNTPLRGKILLSAPNYPAYQYGDWLKFECALQTPGQIEDFNYGKFLAVKGIYSACYWPKKLAPLAGNLSMGQKTYRAILAAKKHYRDIINQSLIYPHSELLNGLTLGLRKGIPEKVIQNFQDTGLTHIIAISGMNITIIAGLIMNLFIALGLKRGRAFYMAVLGLVLFLLMIGWQASAVRAGIMGFILLLAEKTGRLNKSTRALLIAAVVILLINPKALLGDAGFQLSFLAVLGIIYFDEPIEKFLAKIKVPQALEIRASLKMTLAAQILVLPILVYTFGNLSFVSPLANILIVPLLPYATILGFIMILCGLIFLPAAILLGYAARIMLGWILLVAEFAARLPGAGIQVEKFDAIWVIIIYMMLGWWIYLIQKNRHFKFQAPNSK
ncbi:hypothetical protein A3H03_00480 [Candidatus Kuenenbacteria bacterium RIFCSPLOWO2_12_FULL_42_13]|uniref:ComEC/Rec2-related protein domain-containing protein n=3 Tax=Candidatus Kueneniibacteriota TaxID=1752740 RepID=A0A1F6G2F0_9BACT|nr:MAG: hypothetical protein A3H55_02045 [Candidatus Kuenenbacteria bacterium RIFCSPLOWO2_02_FULL_42_16]OGG92255.1 MAG: hypothetical protein A3H03_00480 [Candidatus Kuenenbacteria bacterium RIFCSPLOWO2_12_FULL_42_13]